MYYCCTCTRKMAKQHKHLSSSISHPTLSSFYIMYTEGRTHDSLSQEQQQQQLAKRIIKDGNGVKEKKEKKVLIPGNVIGRLMFSSAISLPKQTSIHRRHAAPGGTIEDGCCLTPASLMTSSVTALLLITASHDNNNNSL